MSSSATRPSPATPRSLVAMDDWLNATSNALVALVFGVVVNGLFQMLMGLIKQASTFSCPAGPTFAACKFVKDKVIFTVKRFSEQALGGDLASIKGSLQVVVLLAILVSVQRWTVQTVTPPAAEKSKTG